MKDRLQHPPQKQPARPYQRKARKFLQQVKNGEIQKGLVAQKVEENLLHCLSSNGNNVPSDSELALDLLHVGMEHANLPHERLIPRLFALACQIMARSGHPRAMQEMDRQIQRLLKEQKRLKKVDVMYNSRHVNDACSQYIHHVVMNAQKNNGALSHGMRQKLNRIIRQLEEYYADPTVPLLPDAVMENAIVLYLCHQHKPQEALDYVQKNMKTSKDSDVIPIEPSVATLTSIIHGFGRIGQTKEALETLQWMLDHQNDNPRKGSDSGPIVPCPNEACFNALLHAYAMSDRKDAGLRAEETLEWMEQLHKTRGMQTSPDATSYNIAINAWARSGHPEAPEYAENLLQRINDRNEAGYAVRPSLDTWYSVMNAWVNSKKPEAVERVTAILDLVEQLASNPNETHVLSVIPYTVLVKALETEGQENNEKNAENYSDKILQVVDRMEAKNVALTPEIFNSVLTALENLSPTNCIFYFLQLEQQYRQGKIQMATRTFNIGLNAITVLNRPDAERKAFDVLARMKHYCQTDADITPSLHTFNIILKALSRSHADDAAQRAEELLLQEMDSMASFIPDSFSYLTCIIAWGRSLAKDKFERVVNLLSRFVETMEDTDGYINQSNIAVFNAVLSVCHHNSTPDLRTSSIDTALIAMGKLRKHKHIRIRPDQTTYASFFRVFQNSLPLDNARLSSYLEQLENEFGFCVEDGYVTGEIIRILSQIAPHILEQRMVNKTDIRKFSALPKAWSRNVKD
jgi:hypothetical protein